MRHYDIPYVKNGPTNYFPATPLQDMTLEEIKKKHIKTCAKANGDVSKCSKCQSPCPEGKRAIQLIANSVYNDPPIPLYGGKTLIERAQEENMKRREEAEKKKEEEAKQKEPEQVKTKKSKDGRVYIEDWFNKAMASEDPLVWIMDAYNISRRKAKQKIYGYRSLHPETREVTNSLLSQETKTETIVKADELSSPAVTSDVKEDRIENKLENLMKLQEEHKKAMDEYMRLYTEAKAEYEKIKQKTDVLCNALDILNDN